MRIWLDRKMCDADAGRSAAWQWLGGQCVVKCNCHNWICEFLLRKDKQSCFVLYPNVCNYFSLRVKQQVTKGKCFKTLPVSVCHAWFFCVCCVTHRMFLSCLYWIICWKLMHFCTVKTVSTTECVINRQKFLNTLTLYTVSGKKCRYILASNFA